jgi:hypothetical protein
VIVFILLEYLTDTFLEAAHTVIVEAEEIKPEQVHLPGLYVNRLFQGEKFEHKIEVLKNSEPSKGNEKANTEDPRELIAHIAA